MKNEHIDNCKKIEEYRRLQEECIRLYEENNKLIEIYFQGKFHELEIFKSCLRDFLNIKMVTRRPTFCCMKSEAVYWGYLFHRKQITMFKYVLRYCSRYGTTNIFKNITNHIKLAKLKPTRQDIINKYKTFI